MKFAVLNLPFLLTFQHSEEL